jgi:membrane associated rhomboid family serine protease
VTGLIAVACTLVFGYELVVLLAGGEAALDALLERRGLVPAELVEAWSAGNLAAGPTLDLFSHMVLHASWLHLFGNLLFLWIFGPNVEDRLGRPTFLGLFLAGGLVAALVQVAADPASQLPMIGASGAVSAVLGAYLVLFPRARIQSLVFLVFYYELIAVPSVLVLGVWFGLQLVDAFGSLGLTEDAAGGVAFWAHVGGFVAGMLIALPLRRLRPAPPGPIEPAPAAVPVAIATPGPPPPPPRA